MKHHSPAFYAIRWAIRQLVPVAFISAVLVLIVVAFLAAYTHPVDTAVVVALGVTVFMIWLFRVGVAVMRDMGERRQK